MKKLAYLAFVMLGVVMWLAQAPWALAATPGKGDQGYPLDIVLVLDNSGSMQKNDPHSLMKSVAINFLESLDSRDQLAMIIFDTEAKLLQPLHFLSQEETRQAYAASLKHLDYRGKWTNSHTAIERAIYELKSTGREDSRKIIIFMTDGILETGNAQRDVEAIQWLKQSLTEEARKNDIHIFGVAFTEAADFSMIQVLAVKTGGEYYRALKAEEIEGVFQQINRDLAKQQAAPASVPAANSPSPARATAPAPAPEAKPEPSSNLLWILVVAGVLLAGVVALLVAKRGRQGASAPAAQASPPSATSTTNPNPPRLLDLDSVTGQNSVDLTFDQTVIGREARGNVNLVLAKPTISSLHATIQYQAPFYYLEDQRSTNGTYLNGTKLEAGSPMRLKSGDEMIFDQYRFRFVVQDEMMMGHTQIGGQGFDDMATQIRPLAESQDPANAGESQGDQWPSTPTSEQEAPKPVDAPPADHLAPPPDSPGPGPASSWGGDGATSAAGLSDTSHIDDQEVPPWPVSPSSAQTPPEPPPAVAWSSDPGNPTQGVLEASLPPDIPPQAREDSQTSDPGDLTQGVMEASLPPAPESDATMIISQAGSDLGATATADLEPSPAGQASSHQEAGPYTPPESPTMALEDTLGEGSAPPNDPSQTAGAGQYEEGRSSLPGDDSESPSSGLDEYGAYDDLNRTMLKMPNCPHHPDEAATELCPVCRQAYCGKCMTEKNGQDICLTCAKS
ncbi:MAG: VWA domain-containing protein [Pseudomonadota bacterium]